MATSSTEFSGSSSDTPTTMSSLEYGESPGAHAKVKDATRSNLRMQLLEDLKRHGTQRLTRSLSAGPHSTLQLHGSSPSSSSQPRRSPSTRSLSACQGAKRKLTPIPTTTAQTTPRESQHLGTVTLPSPAGPEAFCLDAVRAWEAARSELARRWRAACAGRLLVPRLGALWNALEDFSVVVELYLCLAEAGGRWLRPRFRAEGLAWRTQAQRDAHGVLGTSAAAAAAMMMMTDGAEEKTESEEEEDGGGARDAAGYRFSSRGSRYPLTAQQLKEFARVCCEMDYQVRQLVRVVKAYNRTAWAHWKAVQAGGEGEGERRVAALREDVERWTLECERTARLPLQFMLVDARESLCAALGLDSARVPMSYHHDDEEEEEGGCGGGPEMSGAINDDSDSDSDSDSFEIWVEDEEDAEHDDGEVKDIPPSSKRMSPYSLKIRILALQLAHAALLSSLRLDVQPGRATNRLLGWMANKPREIMARIEDDEQAGLDSARAKLQELDIDISELVERTTQVRTIRGGQAGNSTLHDTTTPPSAYPSWYKRAARRVKAKVGYLAVLHM